MSSLTIYKASAGSGKTFTLAVEYIKFLISDPTSYRNILAVTFTNKATEEMKSRIIAQLYGISHHLPDSQPYLEKIVEDTKWDADMVRTMSALALNQLIHNYDYFHVETIDTFFQSVLRNLAKELDLSANLRIELNDVQIEEQAVDMMIEELNRKSPLFSWLIRFIMDNINENKGWNVVRSVKSFGKLIFNDEYRQNSQELNKRLTQKGFIDKYTKELLEIRDSLNEPLHEIKEKFYEIMSENRLQPDCFRNGSRGIGNYFSKFCDEKLEDKTFMAQTIDKCLHDEEQWVKKSDPRHDEIIMLVGDRLMPLLKQAEELRRKAQYNIMSVNSTLQNIKNLRLLNDIERKVRESNTEANRFLLSDTQHLLNMMISDTDSPFIFEKIGTRLKHIMIDEFQDTSTIQWKNFLVLLDECISTCQNEKDVNNLIVGDVKQSIYRWRSGDWQLLNDIDKYFPGKALDPRELRTNYRSAKNIITFNNAFFDIATANEVESERKIDEEKSQKIQTAYSDVRQQIKKEDTTGLVRIKLLSAEDYDARMLQEIENTIDVLLNNGVSQSAIAILLRTNKYIPVIAEYFMQKRPEINLVSDEAFRLDSSMVLNTLVAALRLLCDPSDRVTKACLIKNYQRYVLRKDFSDNDLFNQEDVDHYLPTDYINNMGELTKMPLNDLTEKLVSIFHLDEIGDESAYLCGFFDFLASYIKDMSSDIRGFINEWDDNIHGKKIQTDEVEGIQLISIHKSKGLEFDNVIMPYCDWKKEMFNDNYIWCHPTVEPYNAIPLLPINYSPKLADSIYAADYRHEHMQNTMDNLNLLYVAFTRAGKNLFVFGKRNASQSRSMLIQNSLKSLSEQLVGATLTGLDSKENDISFEYGDFLGEKKKEEKQSENVFLKKDKEQEIKVESNDIPIVFRQSNKSKDFVADIEGGEEAEADSYVKTGNILHLLFSQIHTTADIPSVLDQFEADGLLSGDGINRQEIERMLNEYMSTNAMVADWFSPHWTLYNECEILRIDEKTGNMVSKRPDRVMKDNGKVVVVDFKFGKKRKSYQAQVKEYMTLINKMGYTDITGYIWYVKEKEIEEISL